ncbi:hypothetical protein KW850_11550 [Bacillus sp. sid0103]|uniref:hypothetical protein n=1 Tax=Bacillus sp. sid0103 TaxID=2856337 RepID=UPI001C46B273|nr:hypothetical protein [Bacillus sp. sid0103]MBV7505890.1 hypothetical protein [Bacillus sp. sid0103]
MAATEEELAAELKKSFPQLVKQKVDAELPQETNLPIYLKVIKGKYGNYIKVNHYLLAKLVVEEETIYRNANNFKYFSEQEGVWKDNTVEYLKKRISEYLHEHNKISLTRETLEHIKNFTWNENQEDIFDKREYALTLSNGTYYFKHDKEESKFIPSWNPLDYSTTKININYDCQQRFKIPFFQRNQIPYYQRSKTAG